jgi:hypothetical protein
MDPSTQRTKSPTQADLAAMFCQHVLPGGMLPEPTTKARRDQPGRSLRLYSRNPKAVAIARCEFLPIQQAGRSLLGLLVQLGRGKNFRSWFKDETLAELLERSGLGHYSVPHLRRWRRVLEDVGLVRCLYIPPGGKLPAGKTPDVDGSGYETEVGQNVLEVNVDALLATGPLWSPRVRGGYVDAREAKAAAAELKTKLDAEAEGRAALEEDAGEALEDVDTRLDAGPPAGEGVIIHDHPRVIIHDHPSTDPGSPTENHSDPPRAESTRLACGSRTPAHAGSRREGEAKASSPLPPTAPLSKDERADAREVSCVAGEPSPRVPEAPPNGPASPTRNAAREREQPPGHHDPSASPATFARGPTEEQRRALDRACGGGLFGDTPRRGRS